ncbi:hypothetical protein SUGI_0592080 [Cryptomeria japonica]|nr:hypothetical protein SUGI_0592080 [Cryptomeria japonica]
MSTHTHHVDHSDKSCDEEDQSCVFNNPIVRFIFGCLLGENPANEKKNDPHPPEVSSLIAAQQHFRQVQHVRLQ